MRLRKLYPGKGFPVDIRIFFRCIFEEVIEDFLSVWRRGRIGAPFFIVLGDPAAFCHDIAARFFCEGADLDDFPCSMCCRWEIAVYRSS